MSILATVSPRKDCDQCGKQGMASHVVYLTVLDIHAYGWSMDDNDKVYICDPCMLGAVSVFRSALKGKDR